MPLYFRMAFGLAIAIPKAKKSFDWGLRIFVSDIISEVVFGPFWLILLA